MLGWIVSLGATSVELPHIVGFDVKFLQSLAYRFNETCVRVGDSDPRSTASRFGDRPFSVDHTP